MMSTFVERNLEYGDVTVEEKDRFLIKLTKKGDQSECTTYGHSCDWLLIVLSAVSVALNTSTAFASLCLVS